MKSGRNDPCPCGSGKKYKKCCGENRYAAPAAQAPRASPSAGAEKDHAQHPALTAIEFSQLKAMIATGRYAEAEYGARTLVDRQPKAGSAWKVLGISLMMQGKDALRELQRATQLSPDDAEAHGNLGKVLQDRGELSRAVASYRRTLEIEPGLAMAHSNLGNALRDLGQLQDAEDSLRRALDIEPDYAEAHSDLGNVLLGLGLRDEAVSSYRRALSMKPHYAVAHNNLGNALRDLGQLQDAEDSLRRALDIEPNFVEALSNLGNVLLDLGRLDEAAISYRRAIALKPDGATAHLNLGMVLRLQGLAAEAEASCRRALAINPDLTAAIAFLGEIHADKGQFADAELLFKHALSIEPQLPEALVGIARYRKMAATDSPWFAAVRQILNARPPPVHEIALRYAVGKYFDDLKDYEQAFTSYRLANELAKRSRPAHDRRQLTRFVDEMTDLFDKKWFSQWRTHGIPSTRPVFIIGMPRSGTTLTEQILSSHPAVFGAGELTFWNKASAVHPSSTFNYAGNANTILELAHDYLRLLQDFSAGALRVVDKMPANFLNLGLIHAALPNARIIHMRRNPIDTCLSIYFQNFGATHSYANDLDDLAHYYTEYLRIMDYWRSILPEEAVMDVSYEDLIDDPEAWGRKLLAFIGLPWDPRCMDFDLTSRTVTSSSKWQVRQKISKSSAGRWRNYATFVGPLLRLAESSPVI